ncbi:phage virion morphogenesis protein [Martelella endophytica]|uniref:Phage virion morphogeneis protein n=1 Tax=Martelella endophytica TaxID=1486262 RepID=A0A0D5LQK4_MAREN|nr:phage virion morphogenesis protein [Martelella endophytica]AJY46489.1 phage virion morphogeneis protein [Martelella endophytica]
MAGVSIVTEIRDKALMKGLGGLMLMTRNTQPMMNVIGVGLVASTVQRFITQTDPEGQAWTPVNKDYGADKRNTRILTESGRLRDSITHFAGNDYAQVGTNVIYARPHQEGAEIVPVHADHLYFRIGGRLIVADRVILPARPFLGISEDDETMIRHTIEGFILRFSRSR